MQASARRSPRRPIHRHTSGSPASPWRTGRSPVCRPTSSTPPTWWSVAPDSGGRSSARWPASTIPLLPMAHQYVRTSAVASAAHHDPAPPGPRPLLPRARRPPRHRLLPAPPDARRRSEPSRRRRSPSPPPTSTESLEAAARNCCPCWQTRPCGSGFNGVFSFTPDGFPLLGESRDRARLLDRRGGLGHPLGGGGPGGRRVDGRRPARARHARVRPQPVRRVPAVPGVCARAVGAQLRRGLRHHPPARPAVGAQPAGQPVLSAAGGARRGVRRGGRLGAPALVRQQQLAPLARPAPRDAWSAPALVADRRRRGAGHPGPGRAVRHDPADPARRDRPGLLPAGPDQQQRRPAGRHGGLHAAARRGRRHPLRRDRRAARRGSVPGRRQRPARPRLAAAPCAGRRLGPRRHRRHLRHRPVGSAAPGTWSQPLADIDVSHAAFGYFKARQAHIGTVPVTMLRLSYVGELGWEIYTTRGPRPAAVGHAVGGGRPSWASSPAAAGRVQQPAAGEGLPARGART